MNSSANDPSNTSRSSDYDLDGTTDVTSGSSGGRSSAHSPSATLFADTQLLATPATRDESLFDALQPFFPMPVVADLFKHLLSLGTKDIEDIAAILQVTTLQSTTQSTLLTAYENIEAITASLLARGIAHRDPGGGGVALVFSTAPRPSSEPTPLAHAASLPGATRAASLPGAAPSATHDATMYPNSTWAASLPYGSPALVLKPCAYPHIVLGLATKARTKLMPELPPRSQGPVSTADVAAYLDALGSHFRDGKVVFAPPMEAALTLIFIVADNFPEEFITGPVDAVKAELFSAIKSLKLPTILRGSLLFAVAKELMHRLEDEVLGYLRLFSSLPDIMLERLRLLDDGHVPNAAISISGRSAKPYELRKFAESLKQRTDQTQASAMLSFVAARDSIAGDTEKAGGELPCFNRYCEQLEAAVFRCTHFGVTPSLDQDAHATFHRFLCSMIFKDKYKKMALQHVIVQFNAAAFKLDSPLPQHDFRAAQDYARRAVSTIASLADTLRSKDVADASRGDGCDMHPSSLLADKLRSKGATDLSRGDGNNMLSSSNRAKVANSAGTRDTPATLLTKVHGLNYPARQAARGKCYYCGSTEHTVRDCDSPTQRCPLCLSNDHHCNQCPMLSDKALQKNV